jgi:DNA polymerase I-like protein with 3'-5' exonuclease and polymerase domains
MARDYSGIEAALVAYLANDAGMYRLAAKVQGMHDFVATHAIGQPADLSWSDADVQGYFATFKKENRTWTVGAQTAAYGQIRQGCKRAGFLSFYGGTAARMQQVEPGLFPDRKTAQWYQDLIFGTFPSIKRWQWQTCEEAEKLGYVTAPSGFRLWYPDGVFEYTYQNRKWEKKFGAVAKECLAAKPQHMGMWCSAKALARAIADPVLAPGLRLSIHDEILGEWDQTQQEDVDGRLKAAMEIEMSEMPLPASWGMGAYVVVQTEAKSGQRWADMK